MLSEEYFIRRSFSLAKKGEGKTSPNPLVGAVIVKKGRIISEGYHKRVGSLHAEIEAINRVGPSQLKGSTLFVNLEPCFHWGRTPPCVDRIISSGIKRVVISVKDPNPLVSGKSIRKLREAKVEVRVGILKREAERLNEVFFKNMRENLPFIVVKFAQTLDGKIADFKGNSKWITSLKARRYSRRLRGLYDAVLVGVNTVLKDNPHLDSPVKKMIKIILDPEGEVSLRANLFKKAKKVFLVTKRKDFSHKKLPENTEIIRARFSPKRGFDLVELLNIFYSKGITSLFVEGGAFTLGKFLEEKLIDKFYIFVAPKIAGDNKALASIFSERALRIRNFLKIKDLQLKRVGRDFLFTGYPSKG
ncbi:MAG: bifunctional diaminohydroxyphosphoribosylaminopyrimidine deaminase/5-amino-6-(5-phosphoribosylamino)uracil reductase RibD [Candidatus Omnitrophica bacterium]|nr:bifunctional diaminohydroxyphosphoribosylaminopyrimidine deaminase/5-amino-6-(5-phosphoribosylamino)uracil reductase RibD [Candidatus Omnitrophota bacterium]